MAIKISEKIRTKLAQVHNVTIEEVEQCFANRNGNYLIDTREEHASDPPTKWFISENNYGRKLKVVFIERNGDVYIRTTYPPNEEEKRIYNKYGKESD